MAKASRGTNRGPGSGRFKQVGPHQGPPAAGSGSPAPHPLAPAARKNIAAGGMANAPPPDKVAVRQEGSVFSVTMNGSTTMRPFLRTAAEPFEDTVRSFARRSLLDVIINGNQYELSTIGGASVVFGGTPAGDATTPMGQVRGRDQLIGGVAEPERFYIAWQEGGRPAYTFGFGDPPSTTSALGGLGPILIKGLRYGVGNRYRKGVPEGAAPVGEPSPAHKPFLEQRSNATYESFTQRGTGVGKVVIAYSSHADKLRIIVQPQGADGVTLDSLRDGLIHDGFDNAVFLDGSDSAMLFANDRFYVRQGSRKDRSNTIGIGFQVR